MGKVNFGAFITEIRGSIGENTFCRNNRGSYIRKKVKVNSSNTIHQQAVRELFKEIVSIWKQLEYEEIESWYHLAERLTTTDIFGNKRKNYSLAIFMKVNLNRFKFDEAILRVAPEIEAVQLFDELKVQINTENENSDIKLYLKPLISNRTGIKLFSTGVVSNGIHFVEHIYKQIGILDSNFISGDSIKAMYIERFINMPEYNQKVYFSIKSVSVNSGFEGGKISCFTIVGKEL